MYKEISKELKASLFQRIKSPFFSSFLIGILIFNYRYILVLLSTKSIEDKFIFIDTYKAPIIFDVPFFKFICIEHILISTLAYPFFFALFWIGITPFFERYISMPIWKKHQNKLKERFAELEKEEVFPRSEKEKYLNEILNIGKEKNKLVEELINIDLATQTKIEKSINEKEKEFEKEKELLNTDFEIRLEAKEDEIKKQKDEEFAKVKNNLIKEKEELQNKYGEVSKNYRQLQNQNTEFKEGLENMFRDAVQEKDNEIKNLKEENRKIKNELFNIKDTKIKRLEELEVKEKESNRIFELQKKDTLKDFSVDTINFLETIYKNNIKDNRSYSNFIDEIQKYYSIKRMDLEKILEDLIEKKFISSTGGYIYYTKDIKDLIYKAFKKNY